ncbi:MAG: gliding motility-associated ABC transporter substrate-binding protein GldG [Flavobacteriales bacterium]
MNRFRYSIHIIILILINVIASFLYFRIDLTQENKHSIDDATKELLSQVDDILYIKVYLDGDFPAGFEQLKNASYNLLEEFSDYSDFIEFEFINPSDRDEASKNKLYKQLIDQGLKPTNLEIRQKDGTSQKIIFPGAVINYKNKNTSLNLLLNQFGARPEISLNNSIENLEFEFSKSIFKLINDRSKKIAFLSGNGQLDDSYLSDINNSLGTTRNSLSEFFSVEFFNLKEYELDENNNPNLNKKLANIQEFDALIIAKPTIPFNELDKFVLDQYVMNNGKVLWLIDGVAMDMDSLKTTSSYSTALPLSLNLDDIMFKFGIRINSDLIMDMQSDQIPIVVGQNGDTPQRKLFPWVYNPLFIAKLKHPIVKNLDAIKSSFVSTIDTVKSLGIRKTPLLFCSPYSKVVKSPHRVSLNILNSEPNIKGFQTKDKISAILLEGKFNSVFENRLTPTSSIKYNNISGENKMIVISDGDIIKNHVNSNGLSYPLGYNHFNKSQYNGNKDFIINCMHFLLGNEDLININSKQYTIRLLDRNKIIDDKLKWQLINLLLPLIIISLFYFSLSFIRKKKYK